MAGAFFISANDQPHPARTLAILNAHPEISWYKVEAENEESIHNHNAYACIEKRGPKESQSDRSTDAATGSAGT